MPTSVAERITAAVVALRELLATASTREAVGTCLAQNVVAANDPAFKSDLSSPARQISFFLGLLVSTPEPVPPVPFGPESWQRTSDLLNQAFGAYFEQYFPAEGQLHEQSEEWKRVRNVAMQAFLHYWNTGLLATVDQVTQRIKDYLVPLDKNLQALIGITATDLLAVAEHVLRRLEESADAVGKALVTERTLRLELLKTAEAAGMDLDGLRRIAQQSPTYLPAALELKRCLDELFVVKRQDLVASFGDVGLRYWELQSIARGSGPTLSYPTDPSVADTRPVVLLDENTGQCPTANEVVYSVVRTCEATLAQSPFKTEYLTHRDRTLENEVVILLRRVLGPEVEIISHVFETPTGHFEHDIIAFPGTAVLIVEAKASPPVAPFRDPDKAFVRLKHAFGSASGIQSGFQQAERLRTRFDGREPILLYSKTGELVRTLDPSQYHESFAVCVTRDNYGPLATDLTILLEKAEATAYPWVTNVFDLGAIGDAWAFLGWGAPELVRYLGDRARCHGKVYGSDELEYAGYFIRHDGLAEAIDTRADLLTLNPSYSDFFDQLYRHVRGGGPPPSRKVTKPVVMDLRQSLSAGQPVFVSKTGQRLPDYSDTPRNAPCPCGSGKRFKRCHGKHTA